MPMSRQIGGRLAIVGTALMIMGCWGDEPDQLTFLGEGGCRTPEGGGGEPTYLSGMFLHECKAQCFDGIEPCAAVEFNTNNGNCEVHFQPITKVEAAKGVACYVVAR